ncbi:hypothetical protein QKU48_gp0648 [Fadolivirus algeromassiliense]|jgi:hypothetical protein|uniref:Uncharacterized protein n=1 Tax=Fadolivirus FV1/VV64 TaxID=3070911 RepID=A0A7D3QVZ9_9VIRU|nr:hypothetical protein QKU48_gp0648 [Fadolivirus algeromassiliense]QKF94106.1 hypothetical protein Fadolivirus_1_648 [Fadolivirus FV1/VV64]
MSNEKQIQLQQEQQTKFIERAIKIHGNKYDYSHAKYINAHTPVEIICFNGNHGSFFQSPNNHIKGKGCKKCAINNSQKGRSRGNEEFIKLAKEVHGDKYDYSEVEYFNKKTNIKIKCLKCNEVFEQTPEVHLRGSNCPKCVYTNRILHIDNKIKDKNIIIVNDESNDISKTEIFIQKAQKVHGNRYDYTDTNYINSHKNVKIKCNVHGIFEQTPSNHLKKYGCSKCGQESSQTKQRFTRDDFIEKAKEVHGDKYDYSKSNYINYGTKVEIICKTHGSFWQTPSNHISHKHCCLLCRNDLNGDNKRDTKEDFINKANLKHNNKYDYSKINYINGRTKVEIVCLQKDHGSFWQTPKSHIQYIGCPKCAKRNFSLKACAWLDYVSKKDNIKIQHAMNIGEYKLPGTNIRVDGYCKENNTVYLFHGIFYHGSPKHYNPLKTNPLIKKTFGDLYIRTLEHELKIHQYGYNVIVMWEDEWDAFYKTLK